MSQAIDIRGPEGKLTRGQLKLKLLTEAWRAQAKGERYSEALLGFIGSKQNPHTRRSYAFALCEFWDWYWEKRHIQPTPDKVRRAEAQAYAQWLEQRGLGLDELRLSQDPERAFDLAIYQAVKRDRGMRFSALRRHLLGLGRFTVEVKFMAGGVEQRLRVLSVEQDDWRGDAAADFLSRYGRPPPNGLDLRLACLCEHAVLRRTPTVAQIRSEAVSVPEDAPGRAQLDYRVDPDLFQYFPDEHTDAQGPERASTVASRLSVLASFWEHLRTRTGENVGDQDALLAHNIWSDPRRRAARIAKSRKQLSREVKTPDLKLFTAVLATTFRRSHEKQAMAAAEAAIQGADVSGAAVGTATLQALRDRAILLFLLLTGVRAEELQSIRRGSLHGSPVLLTVIGKGDKTRTFVVPDAAVAPLVEFQTELERRAAGAAPGSLLDLLTEDESPLFPPLKLWGRNERTTNRAKELKGLSPSGLARMLHRRAEFAGFERGSSEYARMHPHGLRHLAALTAKDRGVDIATIQATMGHASLAYTGHYLEVRDPAARSLVPAPAGRATARPAPPRPPERRVHEAAAAPAAPQDEADGDVVVELEPERPADRPVVVEVAESLESTTAAEEPGEEPASGGLIGVGEAPEELPPDAVLIEPQQLREAGEAPELVRATYEDNWGERKSRARTWLKRGSTGAVSHAYVGKRTGLPWWEGAGGRMHSDSFRYVANPDFPSMPVMSPTQLLGPLGQPDCSEQLCLELVALYDRWLEDPERGPTAAAALSRWVRAAARVTLECDEVIRSRHGGWVPFDAPIADTKASAISAPTVLRTHLDGAVLSWFEQVGWQYRDTGEGVLPSGEPLEIPAWYRKADPLSDLSEKQRGELLDWLQVWVGKPPRDRTARFDGLSRFDIGKFLALLCQYEMVYTDEELDAELKQAATEEVDRQIKLLVSKLTAGKVADYSYTAERKGRKERRVRSDIAKAMQERGAGDTDKLEATQAGHSKYLGPHFMRLVDKLCGKEAGSDPILQLFSLCTAGAPLGREGDKYKQLFRVVGGSIKHDEDFARQFAAETGAHSECVARRLARHLYEEGKPEAWYRRKNWPERLDYLDALAAYRIPCPSTQEQELAKRLPERQVPAVLEEWERAGRRLVQAAEPDDGQSDVASVMRSEQERDIVPPTRVPRPNPRSRPLGRAAEARRLLPNPVMLYGLAAAMRRAVQR